MKNYLSLLLFLPLLFVNCSDDETIDELSSEDLTTEAATSKSDFDQLSFLVRQASSELGTTADNPIVIGADTFVDHVDYVVPICGIENNTFPTNRFAGVFYGSPLASGVSSAPSRYRETSAGCFELIPRDESTPTVIEYKFNTYYEIFGVVVRLSDPLDRARGFWFADIDNSNQVRRVEFNSNGTFTLGSPIDFPYEVGVDCSNAIDFPTGSYVVNQFPAGQRAVRNLEGQDFLYVSTGLGFSFFGTCGSADSSGGDTPPVATDICDGIPLFNQRTRYKNGDQVVFDGYLFTKVKRSWRRDGKCGA
ncbi:MAG: hypothetical protein WBG71_10880 [Leeuwenhoekiella sp.]